MRKLIVTDRIYGTITIREPVILALLESPTLVRLKGIDQAGFFKPQFPHAIHTRFEHSVGVYYLLQKFGAGLEEQVAGLIHDVSHGVFSHCLDYALGEKDEGKQAHQDVIFEKFVKKSDIPNIIKHHGFRLDYILNDKRHPLKETIIPELCADRLDYSLRTANVYMRYPRSKIISLLSHLTIRNNIWTFTNFHSAQTYAELFYLLNTKYYSGFPSAIMFRTVGDVLSYALGKNYLTNDDLYKTDAHVLTKIKKKAKNDSSLTLLFNRMCNPKGIKNNLDDYDAAVVCKSRIVDPYYLDNGSVRRFSDSNPKWKKIVKDELQPKKWYLKFSTYI